jgi:hypothetical protein
VWGGHVFCRPSGQISIIIEVAVIVVETADVTVVLVIEVIGGLVVTVPGYRSKGQGSIPGATRFSEK